MKNVFALVAAAFQSVPHAVMAANAFDLAYNTGVGNPAGHTPFDAVGNPQMVAMNQAGLYAADTTAHMIAMKDGQITEEGYLNALKAIASGDLTVDQRSLADLSANLAWRAGQPFRDITTKPFDRMGRSVNQPWATLSAEEQGKDFVQTQKGADLLLDYIKANS